MDSRRRTAVNVGLQAEDTSMYANGACSVTLFVLVCQIVTAWVTFVESICIASKKKSLLAYGLVRLLPPPMSGVGTNLIASQQCQPQNYVSERRLGRMLATLPPRNAAMNADSQMACMLISFMTS